MSRSSTFRPPSLVRALPPTLPCMLASPIDGGACHSLIPPPNHRDKSHPLIIATARVGRRRNMFSSSAAGRVCSVTARTTAPASTTSSVRSIAASCSSSSRHQRRLSSSKASVPPNEDSEGRKVAAASKSNTSGSTRKSRANKSARNAASSSASTSAAGAETVKTGAVAREKKQDGWVPLKTLFPEMPEPVRATNHLKREGESCIHLDKK